MISPSGMQCVLVIGSGRSGTSALAWALAQHPAFWTSSEANFVFELYGRSHIRSAYERSWNSSDPVWLKVHHVDYSEFCRHIGEGVQSLMASRAEGRIWVDATPSNSFMASDLALMFPTARFLHIVRDGREVVESLLASGFDIEAAKSFEAACKYWRGCVDSALALESAYPERVLRVSHAQMCRAPAVFMEEILSFLGVEQSDAPSTYLSDNVINSSFKRDAASAAGPTASAPARAKVEQWSWIRQRAYRHIAGTTHERLFGVQ